MRTADSAIETTTTTGTGPLTLLGAVVGGLAISTDIAVGVPFTYRAENASRTEWEVGTGELSSASVLVRSSVIRSSNGNAPVNFSAGTKTVFVTLSATQINKFAAADDEVVTTVADPADARLLIEVGGLTKRISFEHFAIAIGVLAEDLADAGTLLTTDIITVTRGDTDYRSTLSALDTLIGGGGGGDTTAPAPDSAEVADAAPTVIRITLDEALDGAFTPATSAFSASGGKTISSVAHISDTVFGVTVNSAYANGDTIEVSYTQPGSNGLRDAAGNLVESFSAFSVTNNIAGGGGGTVLDVTFDGAAGTSLPSYNALFLESTLGSAGLQLDGSGGVRELAVSDQKSVVVQTSSADHYVEVVLGANWNNTSNAAQTAVRQPANARYDGYDWRHDGTAYRILKNGSSIEYAAASEPAAGDTMRLEAEGDTITLKRNGTTVISKTDAGSALASNTHAGFLTRNISTQVDDAYRSMKIGTI